MSEVEYRSLPMHVIIRELCEKYNITVQQLLGARRSQPIAQARQEGYWRASRECGASLPQIARVFNRANHTTVWYGIRRHEERLKTSAGVSDSV